MKYLYEAYTPEMDRIFRPYLKEIADKMAKRNISVQDAEFTEIELPKPVALSSVNKVIRAQYEVYGNFDCVLALLKHSTGGVTVGSFENTGRGKVSAIDVTDEYGDTDGKVTDAYVAELSNSDYQKLRKLRDSRSAANAPYRDSHDISGKIKRRLALTDNPNIKAILNKAKALGFYNQYTSIKSVQYSDSNKCYLQLESFRWESEQWVSGVPHIYVDVRWEGSGFARRTINNSPDDNVNTFVYYNASTCGLDRSDTEKEYNVAVKSLKEIIRKIEQAKELSDFINSFTYEDLLVDGDDDDDY
jgi:hypothetical protein